MVVFSVVCAYVAPTASTEQSVLEKAATETMTTNPVNTQGFGAGEQTAPAAEAAPAATEAPAETPKAE